MSVQSEWYDPIVPALGIGGIAVAATGGVDKNVERAKDVAEDVGGSLIDNVRYYANLFAGFWLAAVLAGIGLVFLFNKQIRGVAKTALETAR